MRIHFPGGEHRDHLLSRGQVAIGSAPGSGGLLIQGRQLSAIHAVFAADRRGFWLTVPDGSRGVHVNARQIHRLAFLRLGDLVCIGDVHARIVAESDSGQPVGPVRPADSEPGAENRYRAALRGLSGAWCGKVLSLRQDRSMGRAASCDVRIEESGVDERHVNIVVRGSRILLRCQNSNSHVLLNGVVVTEAQLNSGDQIQVGSERFLIEAPGFSIVKKAAKTESSPQTSPGIPVNVSHVSDSAQIAKTNADTKGMIWLIAAAMVLAAAITGLLLYSPS